MAAPTVDAPTDAERPLVRFQQPFPCFLKGKGNAGITHALAIACIQCVSIFLFELRPTLA